jgi:hypothetical protein
MRLSYPYSHKLAIIQARAIPGPTQEEELGGITQRVLGVPFFFRMSRLECVKTTYMKLHEADLRSTLDK